MYDYNENTPNLEFQKYTLHRAAKDHICQYCRRPILKGSIYTKVAFKVDGEFGWAYLHTANASCLVEGA